MKSESERKTDERGDRAEVVVAAAVDVAGVAAGVSLPSSLFLLCSRRADHRRRSRRGWRHDRLASFSA